MEEISSVNLGQVEMNGFPMSAVSERRNPQVQSKDTLQTTREKGSSWGNCILGWICCIPNLVWQAFKSLLHLISCRKLCREKPKEEPPHLTLEDVLKKWKHHEISDEEKNKILDDFKQQNPKIFEKLLDNYLEEEKLAGITPPKKGIKEDEERWKREKEPEACRQFYQKLSDHDVDFLEKCIKEFEIEQKNQTELREARQEN